MGYVVLAAGACSTIHPESEGLHEVKKDPWRASNRATGPATQGDVKAQDVFFAALHARLMEPFWGGEDLEQMTGNTRELLEKLGDEEFARALSRQAPEVKSAAKFFLPMERVAAGYPETMRMLEKVPEIKWPAEKAMESGGDP